MHVTSTEQTGEVEQCHEAKAEHVAEAVGSRMAQANVILNVPSMGIEVPTCGRTGRKESCEGSNSATMDQFKHGARWRTATDES